MIYTAGAEGQPNGTVLSTASSGSAGSDAFSSVVIGSGASLLFSSAASTHGSQSYAFTGSNNTATYAIWDGFNDTSIAVRIYYNPGASLPNAAMRFIDIRSSTTSLARLSLTNANRLFMQDYNGTNTKWTSAAPLNTNTWYRIEIAVSVSAGSATMRCDYFAGDSLTPEQPGYSTSAGNTGSDPITMVRLFSGQNSPFTGTSYFDDLAASNEGGTGYIGPYSASGNAPSAPQNVTAAGGNGQATVSYNPPLSTGGATITSYTATSSPGGISNSFIGSTATPITVGGLNNGTAYSFTVTASNAHGTSDPSSASNSVTPAGIGGLVKNNAEGQPAGTAVTDINSGGGSGAAFSTVSIGSGASLLYSTDTSMHGSQSYALTGSNGTGTFVTWSNFNDPVCAARVYYNPGATLPGVGLRLIDIRDSASSMLRLSIDSNNRLFMQDYNGSNTKWTASSPLTANTWYRIEVALSVGSSGATMKCAYYLGDSTTPLQTYSTISANTGPNMVAMVRFGSAQSALWTGTAYYDDLAATAQGGSSFIGPYSTTDRPGQPLNPSGVFGNGQAIISYDAPVYNGGQSITGYTVTASPGGATASSSGSAATPITVSGLTNGTSYTFTVHATNASGNGPESVVSDAVTPATVPGAPTSVVASVSSGQTSVAFTPPASNGGGAITNYTVTSNPGGFTASGLASPIVINGMTNGRPYTFTVTATNAAGTGAASAASNSVTPFSASRSNSAEGQPDGTAVTPANSGGTSGDALNTVTVGSGATLKFSGTTSAHGTQSYALTNASGTATIMSWTGLNDTSIAVRMYFNMGASVWNAATRLIDIRNSTTSMARISTNTANRLFMQDYNATNTKWTASVSLLANTWYRIEIAISVSATAATMKCEYYLLDGASPVATGYSTTTGNTGSANITQVNFGSLQSATWTGTGFYDDLAIDPGKTTYIGGPTFAAAGADQLAVEPGATVTLDGSLSGGSLVSYAWSQTSSTSGSTIALRGVGAIVTLTAPMVSGTGDTSVFTLTVVDTSGIAYTDTVTIKTLPPATSYLSSSGNWTPSKISYL